MINRNLIFFFALVLLSITLNAQDIYRVTGNEINVRDTNNLQGKVIGSVSEGTNVKVLDSTGTTFFKVALTNGQGWMSRKFLEKVAVAPVVKAQPSQPAVAQGPAKTDSNLIFLMAIAVILLGMLFIIFKFLKNIIVMVPATIIVLGIGWFSFSSLLMKKRVNGKYVNSEDAQYQSFEFKANNTVTVTDNYADSVFTATYQIEDNMVRFKQQENVFILMIRDDSTLMGEGFIKGTFVKRQ